MIIWVSLAVAAQALAALTVFIDKYVLVSKQGFKSPTAFAFYTAMLSSVVLVLLPFGVVGVPSSELALTAIISAMLYLASLVFLYRCIQEISVTEVIPITTASGAIATGILASLFLVHDLPLSFIPAFLLLIVGAIFIYCFCFPWRFLLMAIASGVLVSSSTFMVKLAFNFADFWTALFWVLIANVFVALILLAPTRFRAITSGFQQSSVGVKGLALFSKVLGGLAFFLTFIAISSGSISIINSLGGLQLVFLLIFVPLFMRRLPDIFSSEFSKGRVWLKILGTLLIVAGLATLFLFQ